MPQIRPFRALRFDPDVVGDLGAVVAPPYDVIGPELHRELLDRHPRNAVRLDLPASDPGDADPDERYRRVARLVAEWRQDGTLHKDPRPAIYVYEQAYRIPGTDTERTQRGFFARLRIEPFGPGGGVLPHERTLSGPKEDRYRLLRATGLNTSPVVGMYEDPGGRARALLAGLTAQPPAADVTDDDRVRHRLWVVTDEGDGAPASTLTELAGAGPVYIADGHHRYETAVRYRDERRGQRTGDEDPPFEYLLMLLLDADDQLTVLPTHRVVRGLGDEGLARLRAGLDRLFTVTPADREPVVARHEAAGELAGGAGRFGLVTREGAWTLQARREAFEPLLTVGGRAVRTLDVSLLAATLDAVLGIDAAAVAGGERISYSKSAREAVRLVDEARDGADAAFLLEPTPVDSILAVSRDGDVMPQKSTYFYPKALTGLVLNPHEW
ncbi:MAG TPA: DUF1015 domain-containing protein [Candidatus Limnocylindrales bacterium]|nr:DUF1015 domain-containing protein [Candidatus Limnocylindrales bacterium]